MSLPLCIDAQGARFEITPKGREALATLDDNWIRDFFLDHATRLGYLAHRFGTPEHLCNEVVTSLLDDIVIQIIESGRIPENVSRYLNAALRNKLRNDYRNKAVRDAIVAADAGPLETGERIAMHAVSEYAVRVALLDVERADAPLSAFVSKLAAFCARTLSESETVAFDALVGTVPLRAIGAELGLSYGAIRVRLHRTRNRMRSLVSGFVASLDDEERKQAEQFFRRAGNRYSSVEAGAGT